MRLGSETTAIEGEKGENNERETSWIGRNHWVRGFVFGVAYSRAEYDHPYRGEWFDFQR
jgi:hypothetical protein